MQWFPKMTSALPRVNPLGDPLGLRVAAMLWLVITLLLPFQPALGAEPPVTESTYHIEVVIFEGKGVRDEGLDGALSTRAIADVTTEPGRDDTARLLTLRTGSALQLAGLREQLTRKGYTVLAHAGWTQTASPWGSRAGLSLATVGVTVPGLEGAFLLERGSLLHFGANLLYTDAQGRSLQLSELRRIRFNERNYYDHPGLGVIAVVSPGVRPR